MSGDEDTEIPGVPMPPRPERAAKFVGRALLAALIGLVGLAVWRVSKKTIDESADKLMHASDTPMDPEAVKDERAIALAAKRAEVAAVDSQIAATKEALDRLEKREKPTFSFGDGERKEFDRLNEETRQLELRRASLAAELTAMEARR